MYKRILLAYDGSQSGQKALLDCQDLAQWSQAELSLVAVLPINIGLVSTEGGVYDSGMMEREKQGMQAVLDDGLARLQAGGHQVAMVGDGLNDGPVLAGAHVSFAFGRAVPLAQSRADFVVLGDSLALVPQTMLLARRTLRVVRQNLVWAACYNALCIPLAVVGWMPAWLAGLGMALSSLLVVLNSARLSRDLPGLLPAGGAQASVSAPTVSSSSHTLAELS